MKNRRNEAIPVVSDDNKFYESIKSAAEFRRATVEEVEVAKKLSKNKGWDRKLPDRLPDDPLPGKVDRLVESAKDQIKKKTETFTGQIINTTPLVSPGVSAADAQLLRLQLGRFDVLWRQYRGRIFATTATVAEEDVQLGKLLEAALANLQRSYDRERSKRQGG